VFVHTSLAARLFLFSPRFLAKGCAVSTLPISVKDGMIKKESIATQEGGSKRTAGPGLNVWTKVRPAEKTGMITIGPGSRCGDKLLAISDEYLIVQRRARIPPERRVEGSSAFENVPVHFQRVPDRAQKS